MTRRFPHKKPPSELLMWVVCIAIALSVFTALVTLACL